MTGTTNDTLIAVIRAGWLPLPPPAATPTPTEAEWRALVQHAQHENLGALFYVALKQAGHLAQLPTDLAESARLTYLKANIAYLHLLNRTSELLHALEAAQIPVVLLKGVALGAVLYPDGALRQVGDLDLLIQAEDQARVATLLQAHAFTPLLDLTTGFRERMGSEQTYTRSGKRALTVDAHWHVINVPSHAQSTSVAWFWARTMRVPFGSRTATVLNWDAQLLHLIEHFVLHHGMRGTRWECDLALLLAQHGDRLDWQAILDAARAFQILPAVRATLARLETAWGVYAPATVRAQLAATPDDWISRAGVMVATAKRPDILILREGLSYRRWRDKIAYLFHYFFPSPSYMQKRYRIAHPLLIPFYYGWRLVLGAQRLVVSVGSVVRHARNF